jgi:hypothetical protein
VELPEVGTVWDARVTVQANDAPDEENPEKWAMSVEKGKNIVGTLMTPKLMKRRTSNLNL